MIRFKARFWRIIKEEHQAVVTGGVWHCYTPPRRVIFTRLSFCAHSLDFDAQRRVEKSVASSVDCTHNPENIISMFWPQSSNNRHDIGVEADQYDLSEKQLNLASD